jgi:hypothetical protein
MQRFMRESIRVGLLVGGLFAFMGCSAAGEETTATEPTGDKVAVSADQLTEMQHVSRNLEQVAIQMDDLARQGALQERLATQWKSEASGFRSVALNASPGATAGSVMIERSALVEYASNVEAFSPMVEELIEQQSSLPKNLQETLSKLQTEQDGQLVQKLGRERYCCVLEPNALGRELGADPICRGIRAFPRLAKTRCGALEAALILAAPHAGVAYKGVATRGGSCSDTCD